MASIFAWRGNSYHFTGTLPLPTLDLASSPSVSHVTWVYRTIVAWEGRQGSAVKRDVLESDKFGFESQHYHLQGG